jgi:TolB-like protein/DNA-binding winged helix-turn-helix (wHTH) protein
MPRAPKEFLHLGPFQLVVADRVLVRDGRPVLLAPRAVEVLVALATHANEVVSKDDLMKAVWPDTFVEEVNLAVYISALRKLLASAGSPLQIETLAKRGYRLVGEVCAVDHRTTQQAEEDVASTGALAPGSKLSEGASSLPGVRATSESDNTDLKTGYFPHQRGLIGISITVVLLLATGFWLEYGANRDKTGVEAAGARIHSLAVLPLQNLSGDPEQDYFAAGITDQLITELAHVHGLRVVSRTSSSQFQGRNVSLPEIASELRVDGVIEGSVARAGNRVRITAQLIEAANDRHLWAGSYEDSLDEVIAVQDRVARDVAREVSAAVNPESSLPAAAARSTRTAVNQQAYDDYLRGLYLWNRRGDRTYEKAAEYFSRATREDPRFAPAFAGLADTYVLESLSSGQGPEFGTKARQAALQALALDGDSAEAHAALGAVSAVFEWDWATAGREFQRSIVLDPNYATAHQWYAVFYLVPMQRYEEAAMEAKVAQDLDPLSPIMAVDNAWIEYLRGNYAQAEQRLDRVLAMDPDFTPALFRLQNLYLMEGKNAESIQAATRILRLEGNESRARSKEEGFAQGGMRGAARADLDMAVHANWPHPLRWGVTYAQLYAGLGDSARACKMLRGSIDVREPALLYLTVDPVNRPVHALACYRDVAAQIGLPIGASAQGASPARETAGGR